MLQFCNKLSEALKWGCCLTLQSVH